MFRVGDKKQHAGDVKAITATVKLYYSLLFASRCTEEKMLTMHGQRADGQCADSQRFILNRSSSSNGGVELCDAVTSTGRSACRTSQQNSVINDCHSSDGRSSMPCIRAGKVVPARPHHMTGRAGHGL